MSKKADRPEVVDGSTVKAMTGCGSLYFTLNKHEDKPFEVFIRMGKAGGCAASQCEAIGRLVSMALRFGIGTMEIVKQLKGISCHQVNEEGHPKSCADTIARVIKAECEPKQEWPPSCSECPDGPEDKCSTDCPNYGGK